jgi:hypothetical protein
MTKTTGMESMLVVLISCRIPQKQIQYAEVRVKTVELRW